MNWIKLKMLLHSDLKLRRWDPTLNTFWTRSVSPIRSYENTIGGGKVMSMNPTYVVPGPYLVACNTPYRALFSLPQTQVYDNQLLWTDDALKDNIEYAIKSIMLNEKERMKDEIVRDALAEIQNELHSNNRTEEVSQASIYPMTKASALNKNQEILDTIVVDRSRGLTTK